MTTDAELTAYQGCDCGSKHHSTGRRAWCLDCSEWCYPNNICEIQELRITVRSLTRHCDELYDEILSRMNASPN